MEELLKQLMVELKEFRSDVDEKFAGVDKQLDSINKRFDSVEKGQEEIKATIRHSITLPTENFTEIRKDIRDKNHSTQADVDLLFREVEVLKRQTNKIEQRLSN